MDTLSHLNVLKTKRFYQALARERFVQDWETQAFNYLTQQKHFAIIKKEVVKQYGLVLVSTGRLKTVKLSVDCDHVKTQIKK